jgi:hypothetical protein
MTKFNEQEVAQFICSQQYKLFEYQVRGLVAAEFGCTTITAGKWVNRLISRGIIKRSGQCAIMVAS